jgi:aminoglycoside phosphotransferase family enzyme
MVEVERYRSLMGDVHSQNKVVQLVHKVEELQDLLVQQRQTTDVSVIVDAHAQIRALNVELAKKTKLIDDLKSKVQHFTAKRNAKDIGQDEDVVEYLVNMVKEKEKTVEELSFKVK